MNSRLNQTDACGCAFAAGGLYWFWYRFTIPDFRAR